MARTTTQKEKSQKKSSDSQAGASTKKNKGKAKGNELLQDQIKSLGGDSQDVELLKDVRDGQLEVGNEDHDPHLSNEVAQFLKVLKPGKAARRKDEKPPKSKEKATVPPTEKKPRPERQEKKQNEKKPKQNEDVSEQEPKITIPSVPKGTKLVFAPGPHWYSTVPPLSAPAPSSQPSAAKLSSLTERAAEIIKRDADHYQSSAASTGHSSSDSHFLNTILTQGTLSDRLSALTLLVQGSPVHNIKALETLRGMAERGRGKGGREEGLKAMRCIVDWWVGGGAPNRKLKYFRDQPFLLHADVTEQHLVMWYFEDWLKKFFFSILQILETYSLDPLQYVRTQSLAFITTLLREKPEQEQNLLRLLVNKMGDSEKAVCSRASYHLLQVLQAHPAMKAVIVREVRSLIFRTPASTSASAQEATNAAKTNSHIRFDDDDPKSKPDAKKAKDTPKMERWNSHSWYYSAVTLNQVVLTSSDYDRETARLLIEVYFEMFREILGTAQGDLDEPVQEDLGDADGESRPYKKKSAKGKEKAVQGAAGFTEVEDSSSRLVSAILTGVNRALPFAKVDSGDGSEMFKKHIDTLFLITHTSTFNISLQALMLILQVVSTFAANSPSSSKATGGAFSTALSDRFYRTLYASLLDPRLSKSNKQAMYLNLLFKAVKADHNLDRVKAFVRRFVQVLAAGVGGSGGPEFVAGGLYLLGELFSTVSGLRELFNSKPTQGDSEDAEEYDPRKRDPQYAHASASPLYELVLLTHHYHPSVSLHARQLLSSMPITAAADLSLNTLSHFLDRFVYKNPKKVKPKGASAMQPSATTADGASGVKQSRGDAPSQSGPVNEESWWKRKVEDVPVDEVFFHTYFQRKHEDERLKKAKIGRRKGLGSDDEDDEGHDEESSDAGEDEESEGDDVNQDEDEDEDKEEAEIWKAMKATMPSELKDDGLMDDSDDIPSDLDDGSDVDLDDEEDEDSEGEDAEEDDDEGGDEDAFSLAEGSDADDLIPLEDMPDGLIEFAGSDVEDASAPPADDEEWIGFGSESKKRKRGDDDAKGRKKIRSLPTFASYEDYAKLIEDSPEDDI